MSNLQAVIGSMNDASLISGDFAEFGVFMADTFVHIAAKASQIGKNAYAFDSFRGMNEPTSKDLLNGGTSYIKGRFDVGGSSIFREFMKSKELTNVEVIEGYIPSSFELVDKSVRFSFAHVDLDHYLPTICTLNWLWNERLNVGGIIVCDDWLPETNFAATLAIKEFISGKNIKVCEYYKSVVWKKTV